MRFTCWTRLAAIAVWCVALLASAPASANAVAGVRSSHGRASALTCSGSGWSIDPCTASVSVGTFETDSVEITLTNSSGSSGTDAVTSDCSGTYFSSCTASPNNPTLAGDGESAVITFKFTSRGANGSQDIHVTFSGSSPTMVATIHVTISGPTHMLGVDAGMTNNDFQSPALCATACFAAAYSFSTVPFYTLDQPRSVSLVYDGDRALPRPFVFADVTSDGVTSTSRYTLAAIVNGSAVTFVNGDATLVFSGSAGVQRLVGQLDARSLSTGVYPMKLIVTATFADSATLADTVNTELMVVNEGSSPIGAGWSVAGLQRLYFPSSGYLIADGDGTAVRFSALSSVAPDFSVLTSSGGVYTRTYPDGTRALFNSSGYLTSVLGIHGDTTAFNYDGSNRLVRVRDWMAYSGSGAPYDTLTYGASGLATIVEKIATATQRTTTVTIGANGSISSIQDPDGASTSFTYDGDKKLATTTDRKGSTTTLAYDAVTWKLATITMPTVAVDAGSGTTSNTQPVVTYSAWQGVGLPRTATSAASPAGSLSPDSVYGRVTDPLSHVSKYTVNRYGQPMVATNAIGQSTRYTRSGFLATHVLRPDGGVDSAAFDAYGRLVWEQPSGREATAYTRHGLYAQIDSVQGNGSRNEVRTYDGNGQLSRIDFAVHSGDPVQWIEYAYNAATKRASGQADQDGHTTGYYYDPKFGNLDTTWVSGGREAMKTFDASGRDSTSRTTGLATFTTLYDVMNRPTTMKDAVRGDSAMLIRYDALDDTLVTDRKGYNYRKVRNALGWVTQSCDAFSNCTSYRYNANGELTSTTNRRGQRIDLTRDALGRVTAKSGANTSSDSFSFAANGHDFVASNSVETDSVFVSPGSGSAASYDSVVTRVGGMRFRTLHTARRGMSGTDTTSIATSLGSLQMNLRRAVYSDVGNLDKLIVGTDTIQVSRNADELPSKFKSSGGAEESFTTTALFAPRDRRNNSLALDSAFRRSYHYDSAARVDEMDDSTSNRQWKYTYDLLGRLTKLEQRSGCTFASSDSLSQDGSGISYTCSTLNSADTMSYDAMGNRTDHGYHPTTGNRYSSFRGDSASYDADGNFTQRYSPTNYTLNFYWSAEARLDSVEFQYVKLARYDYNALGKPVVKYTKSYGGSWAVSSYYIWDGDQLLLELDGSGNRRADYTYFPGTIDQPAAQSIGATTVTTTRDFRFDATGSVIGTVQGTGVSQKVAYSQWGGPDFAGNSDNHLMWKGLLYNEDVAGLVYMRGRWYDPAEGRFYNEDPIGHAGGENLYSFSDNDPINGTDPSGMMQCSQSYLDLGYHTSFDDMGRSWCIPGTIGGGSTLPPVIVWAKPDPGTPDPASPFHGFGGNGDFPSGGGGSSWGPTPSTKGAATRNLFGTHWCGPGGSGSIVNATDAACYQHDACYGTAGLSANFNSPTAWIRGAASGQVRNARSCNQKLCDAVLDIYFSNNTSTWNQLSNLLISGYFTFLARPGTTCR